MSSRSSVKTPKNQQGIALLIMIIVIILAFATYSLSGLSINQVKTDNKLQTGMALKNAKDALLAYAMLRSDISDPSPQVAVYGYLPCPANNNGDGNSLGSCGIAETNVLGWFPWRSLRIAPLKDGNGDCLLYAVSSTYKFNPAADMLNQDSYGMFQIRDETGAITQDRVVAIIFSSGKTLAGQNRINDQDSECNNDPNNFSAYLDSFEVSAGDVIDNSDVDTTNVNQFDEFIHATSNSENTAKPYNDVFVTITRDEIRDVLFKHSGFVGKMENLTQALAMCLAEYANHVDNTSRRLPWPAKTDLAGADYKVDASYLDDDGATGGYSGRFPFNVANSNNAINAAVLLTDEIFDASGCNALALTGSGLGVTVDLSTPTSEYRKLWNHWKDHFFYILSKKYEPDDIGVNACTVSAECVTINVSEYAGAVIFGGKRLYGVVRGDKSVISDYLEDGKAAVFGDESLNKGGNEIYSYTDPQTEAINDIMYCIKDNPVLIDDPVTPLIDETDLAVVECI